MKLFAVLGLMVIAALALPACAPSASAQDCSSEEVCCAGLVTDVGKINDRSFNQSCWEGLQRARSDGAAERIEYVETTSAGDYAGHIARFADDHYDVVITCGFALTEDTYSAARNYPGTFFIGVDQFLHNDAAHPDWPLANLVGLQWNEDRAGFLVGALAASMSKTHKIGAVCGQRSVPAIARYGDGYRAGARYLDGILGTDTEVSVAYHLGTDVFRAFADPEWGANTASAMIDQGVDVVFGCGRQTGNAAISKAAERGVYVIGADVDQYYTLPEAAPLLLSSAIRPIPPPVAELIAAAADGSFQGGLYTGPAGYSPFHDTESQIPAEVKSILEDILAGLTDGSIQTGVASVEPTP